MLALIAGLALATLVALWAFERSRRTTHPMPEGYHEDLEFPHGREFALYHNALSLCSMKTRVCLAELGIDYENHHVDLIETGAYENIRSAFLSVNPAGTVPVLLHHGHPIYESHAQIRYVAEHAPAESPKLSPDDPALRAQMEEWIDRSSLTEDPLENGSKSAGNAVPGLTLPLFAAMIDQIATWKILEGLLFHFDRRRPLLFLTLKLLDLPRLPRLKLAMQLLARSRHQLGVHLDALEKQLVETGGPFILGPNFSLADVSWLVVFQRLVQADCLHVFVGGAKRPACDAYWKRLTERASYRAAILDCSHPIIDHGTRRLQQAKAGSEALRIALEGA